MNGIYNLNLNQSVFIRAKGDLLKKKLLRIMGTAAIIAIIRL